MSDALRFPAQIIKLQTMQDGAIRLTLDLPETAIDIMAALAECKTRGGLLEIAAVPVELVIDPEKQKKNRTKNAQISARSEWQSEGTTQEGPRPDQPA